MICLNDVFLRKPIIALNFISECIIDIFFLIFGKIRLNVTEKGITFLHFELVLSNRVDLSRLSTFSIWLRMMFFVPFFNESLNHVI